MLLELFHKGGPVMWPLLACSLLSVTVSLERAFFWIVLRRRRRRPELDAVVAMAAAGERNAAVEAARRSGDPAAAVLCAGLENRLSTDAMQQRAIARLRPARRGLKLLDTIVTVAPMLGLLGTVTGVIGSFGFFQSGGPVDTAVLGRGIAEALLTTAFGLSIAILTVVAYNYFGSLARQEAEFLSEIGTELEESLASQGEVP